MKFIEIDNDINEERLKFLYNLLDTRKYSISHKNMPSFKDHVDFVYNHPYHKWFIIENQKVLIGSLYIHKDNSVGVDVMKQFEILIPDILSFLEKNFKPLPYIKSLRSKNFFFNLSPENIKLHNLFLSAGYRISQISFEKNIL